ncbi:MAG: hypothetical protein IJY12_00885, partial [Clostridia bacterium]|nr:hypothetical protein [Clostridia bacterium]
GLYHPKVARYQLRHTQMPSCERSCIITQDGQGVKHIFEIFFKNMRFFKIVEEGFEIASKMVQNA